MSTISEFSDGLAKAVERAGTGTVLVDARHRFPASGVAYAADLVLTADHVVTREDNLTVRTGDGKAFAATVAGRDPGSDLAVLRLSEKALTPASVAGTPAKVGELVLAIGRPG